MSQIQSISSRTTLRDRLDLMPSVADAARLQSQQSFEQALGQAQSRVEAASQSADASTRTQEEVRAAAEELVARALVQPIMSKLRESRDTAAPFGPNEVERTFGSISDAQFADRLTKSGNWPLVDVVAQRILNAGKATNDPSPASSSTPQSTMDTAAAAPLSIAAWAGLRKGTR
jgi:hypothetical protein